MTKKIFKLGVTLIMCLGIFAGCSDDIARDTVSVSIKEEYKDKFLSKDFSIDDFEWENIDRIEYGTWHSTSENETGFLTVHLKKHGKKQVKDAVKHLNSLDFIHEAESIGITKHS